VTFTPNEISMVLTDNDVTRKWSWTLCELSRPELEEIMKCTENLRVQDLQNMGHDC
jgi:hypothetical protein